MKISFYLFILVIVTILGCSKEDSDIRLPYFEIPEIHGFILRNDWGDYLGRIGNPDIKTHAESNQYSFDIYPNPSNVYINVYCRTPVPNETKKIWVTQAQYNSNIPNYSLDVGMVNINTGGIPLIQAEFTDNQIRFDVSFFSEGYYRIFIQIDKVILYENLIVCHHINK